jgi:RNA polymerase sigma-70 factor (ECF subfamily)
MLTIQQMKDLYNEIAPRLTNYLVANGESYESAKDLVQDTFIKLWSKREQFSLDDNISAMSFTIAKNLRIDKFRRDKFMVEQEEFDVVVDQSTLINPTEEEEYLEYIRNCLKKALDELPEELRECYTLFNIGEMSIKEIAKQLSISESLVKVRIHRAKEKLADSLSYLKNLVSED